MSKERFLSELREYLSILEDQEQEDILAEYAQHIDMKMLKGLSEEEAIRDFGSVKELAAEILAAYHVDSEHALAAGRRGIWPVTPGSGRNNAGFGRSEPGRHGWGLPGPGRIFGGVNRPEQTGQAGSGEREKGLSAYRTEEPEGDKRPETFFGRFCRQGKELLLRTLRGMQAGLCWIGRKCRGAAAWCVRPFTGRGTQADSLDVDEEYAGLLEDGEYAGSDAVAKNVKDDRCVANEESAKREYHDINVTNGNVLRRKKDGIRETKERSSAMGGFFGAIGRGMVQMWQWMLDCCIFGLRLCWNTGWLLFSLLCAGIAMVMLLGVGMTIVLLCCGYPFTGIFITGLGGLLCFGALAAGGFGMMIRKKKENEDGTKGKKMEEVHYEQTA
ncbi:MAG: DUF1700 domain-containing protein [Lachnospiraceae bacterium]|nr:DUF1700 domain-containing protein [Lachnospiraceae bacterium]